MPHATSANAWNGPATRENARPGRSERGGSRSGDGRTAAPAVVRRCWRQGTTGPIRAPPPASSQKRAANRARRARPSAGRARQRTAQRRCIAPRRRCPAGPAGIEAACWPPQWPSCAIATAEAACAFRVPARSAQACAVTATWANSDAKDAEPGEKAAARTGHVKAKCYTARYPRIAPRSLIGVKSPPQAPVQRRLALNAASAALPGTRSASDSAFNGVSDVSCASCRSCESGCA